MSLKERFKSTIAKIYGSSLSQNDTNEMQEFIKTYEEIIDRLKIPDHTLIATSNSKGWVKVLSLSALLSGSEIETFLDVSKNQRFNTFLQERYRPFIFQRDRNFDFRVQLFNTLEYNAQRFEKFILPLKRKDTIVSRKSSENYYSICVKFFEQNKSPILLDSVINRNSWHAHPYQSISKLNYI